jgi:hypothetical protein
MRIPANSYHRQFGGNLPVYRAYRQVGGGVVVYRGMRDTQYGRGIADILRSIGKFAAPLVRKAVPVVLKTGKKLVKAAIKNREEGASWGESFNRGLAPAARTALKEIKTEEDAADDASNTQKGSGRVYAARKMMGYGCAKRGGRRKLYKDLLKCDVDGRPTHFNF